MKKSILLPTDLTITSLYPIHEICKNAGGEQCNIYIVHTLDTPTGIMDLLFLQERKPYKLLPPAFLEAIEMLRKKYSSAIHLLSFEFLYSNTRAYLRNYMQGRNIQSVYLLKDHVYENRLPQSVSCVRTLRKCKVPIIYVEGVKQSEVGILTTLLYKEKMLA
jgi:hypothetical protein